MNACMGSDLLMRISRRLVACVLHISQGEIKISSGHVA